MSKPQEKRYVVARAWGRGGYDHKVAQRIFCGDETILCLDYGGGYMVYAYVTTQRTLY